MYMPIKLSKLMLIPICSNQCKVLFPPCNWHALSMWLLRFLCLFHRVWFWKHRWVLSNFVESNAISIFLSRPSQMLLLLLLLTWSLQSQSIVANFLRRSDNLDWLPIDPNVFNECFCSVWKVKEIKKEWLTMMAAVYQSWIEVTW